MMKVAFKTLGCKLNFSETSTISREFTKNGYEKVDFDEKSDIYVINTCSVTQNADKEFKYLVNKTKKNNPDAYVVAIGCYAQLKPREISLIDGVDLVLGADKKFDILNYLEFDKKISQNYHSCEITNVDKFKPSNILAPCLLNKFFTSVILSFARVITIFFLSNGKFPILICFYHFFLLIHQELLKPLYLDLKLYLS